MKIKEDIVHFFQNQRFVIVSTIDPKGFPHNSCKGIVKIDDKGWVYLLDLYMKNTFQNLRQNPVISVTGIDEHKFIGYCLKGKARIIPVHNLKPEIFALWEEKINSRISHRIIRNLLGEKGHPLHPEALFPNPEYMILVKVSEVVDITSYRRKE